MVKVPVRHYFAGEAPLGLLLTVYNVIVSSGNWVFIVPGVALSLWVWHSMAKKNASDEERETRVARDREDAADTAAISDKKLSGLSADNAELKLLLKEQSAQIAQLFRYVREGKPSEPIFKTFEHEVAVTNARVNNAIATVTENISLTDHASATVNGPAVQPNPPSESDTEEPSSP